MSTSNTYVMVLARTVDILLAGWIWRTYDVTISTLVGLELRKAAPAGWARVLGAILNRLQRGHCELAIAADRQRAQRTLALLG